ncbi:MAG TPA: gliding motility-associated C-terminal domain-containing protein [Flavisolibacter sp.]|nr:gliding motility-associated C-terminal domain-containing protein [Flavisolibacter sp.]
MKYVLTILCLSLASLLSAQTCTTPGQNPATAFPVCGTSSFSQSSVPLCGGRTVPSPTCSNTQLTDINPFWYKFTCFQSGTLGFKITPLTNTEDYDWQLFDITNRNPDEIYTNVNLVVGCNWSGEGGETGASAAGSQVFVCDGFGKPLWSKMPQLEQGHEYLLLVSHFTNTQSGYSLSFGGGTAVITDTTPPGIKAADASCGGDLVKVKLNKRMRCNSITPTGSEFFITPGNIPVNTATAIGCANGFDTDSVHLQLGAFLPPGTYTLNIRQGGDANTILDVCQRAIPLTDRVDFTVYPNIPTPMDSLVPPTCKPQSLRLVFKKPMLCASVAANGSDFTITGPYPVTITGARGNCTTSGTASKEIIIDLAQPLFRGGSFTLRLNTGSDGNTVFDECGKETPAGATLVFNLKDTVNADFSYQKLYGCVNDTVNYFHPGADGVNSWKWSMDDNKTSTAQNPQAVYQVFDTKQVELVVSNGFCTDSSRQAVELDNFIKADFTAYDDLCPNEETSFTSTAQGRVTGHHWSFGDGGSSNLESPKHTYSGPSVTTAYTVRYTITDSIGCQSVAQKTVKVYISCYLAVPSGFTPNNDGRNDMFYPLNAVKAEKLDFRVYNRWGQLVFRSGNWKQGWDGRFGGLQQPTGVYVWFLSYTDRDTKQPRQLKGTVALIR